MSGARPFDRALARDVRELRDVRARGEDERLSGDYRSAEIAAFELSEQTIERLERLLPKKGRLRPVLAVVDRHEREIARARELELSDRHRCSPPGQPPGSPELPPLVRWRGQAASPPPTAAPRPCPCRRTTPSSRNERRAAHGIRTPAAPSGARRLRRADVHRRLRRHRD